MPYSKISRSFHGAISALFLLPLHDSRAAETIVQSLAGQWQVQLQQNPQQVCADPTGRWQPVMLPGSLTSNGVGDAISPDTPWMGFAGRGGWATEAKYAPYRQPGNIKVPFWLQPAKYYKGKAWYRRETEIPADWREKSVILLLERCHWGSSVWVDGKAFTSDDSESLSAPHRYELNNLAPGNHPSFVLFAHGNEPWELDNEWLNDTWVTSMKKFDSRHLVAGGSHYPLGDNNDFHVPGCTGGFHIRYHGSMDKLPATTRNYEDQIALKKAPCIAHETGQWCVFPNLDEIMKYTGVMKANNFVIVGDFLTASGMRGQEGEFLMASGKFQTLLYKEEIEAYLRTRGIGGYQLLGLNDFPGQGTALVGVVDVFWDSKPYVKPAEYKRFSGPVVLLAIMEKRAWTNDETFKAQIRIAQYSSAPLTRVQPLWKLSTQQGMTVAKGRLPVTDIPVGNATELGIIEVPLSKLTEAAALTLEVRIPGTGAANDWKIWVYPKTQPDVTGEVLVCSTADEALTALQDGRKVLLAPAARQIGGNAVGSFQPIFWNKNWFPGQKEHTLGLLVDKHHPALAEFPTDFHADWQWWNPMQNYKPMILDGLPRDLVPIVQPIDDWNTCRKLAMVFEAMVGKGRLMVVSTDLQKGLESRPVARQLRHSLLAYINSEKFQPKVTLTENQVRQLLTGKNPAGNIANVCASSANEAHPAASASDGDPTTFWHTEWKEAAPGYPHEFTLELTKSARLTAVNLLPRQDGNANGWVKQVAVQVSAEGKIWQTVAKASLTNNQEWK